MMIGGVSLRVLCLIFARLGCWLVLLSRSAASKDAGLLVLGHRGRGAAARPIGGRGWTGPAGRCLLR
jgi:hypothetical protein